MTQTTQASTKPPGDPLRTRSKRAVLAVLFSTILLIPRVRRLRRRVGIWTAVRAAFAAAGAALVWRFARGYGGIMPLLTGILLVGFGVLVRARPQNRSLDDVTRELGALVAVNGGTLADEVGIVRAVTIFVAPDRLIVWCAAKGQVTEIRVAQLREVKVRSRVAASELELRCGNDRVVCFRYRGTFADHLARVAQDTIMSVWKKSLTVLQRQ